MAPSIRPIPIYAILQGLPCYVLHRDEGLVPVFPHLMDVADIGVIQSSRQFCLPQKALPRNRVFLHFLGRELQSDFAIEGTGVLSKIDLTHPALTEFLQDAIVGDGLAYQRSLQDRGKSISRILEP